MPDPIAPPNTVEQPVATTAPEAGPVFPEDNRGVDDIRVLGSAIAAGGKDPKANVAASDIVNRKIQEDADGHINTQAQWGAVIANLLGRNYVGALNAYNGGLTKWEEGRTANGRKFYKEYNSNGYTGRMADVDKNLLDQNQQKMVEEGLGGVITNRDKTALDSGLYQGLKASELSRISGLSLPVVNSMENAYKVNQVASRMNSNINELDVLTKKLSGKESKVNVLDLIHNAPADIRENIFRFKTGQKASATGETTGQTKSESESGTKTKSGTVGGGGTIGKRLLGGSANVSATETQQGTSSQNKGAEYGTTSSSSAAGQEDIQSKIMGYVQSKVKDPEAVKEVMRWIQLTQSINESRATLEGAAERAPGVVNVPPTELGVTDTRSAFENNINLKRNNALEGAWSAFLAHNVRAGRQNVGKQALAEEFQNSKTYQGINSMYDHELETNKTGKQPEIKEGTIHVDSRNRPVIYRNGKWESLNER